MTDEYSDAAKRVRDTYNLHKLADPYGNIGRWFAVALDDGRSDNTLYESKSDCVRHQHHDEFYYAYVQVTPGDMDLRDAETFLAIHRRMYEKNIRMVDRDHVSGGREIIKRAAREDQYSMLRALFRGIRPPSNLILPRKGQ